ncbi:hypothetical protein ACVWZ4_000715 [Bradyrhizobium sp. USDA 4472]
MSSQSTPQFVTKTATSASAFIDSIGVNTHLAFDSSPYSNISEVSASLNYLGVHNVRDNLYTTTLASSGFATLAARGYKFDFAAALSSNRTIDMSKFISALDSYASQYPGSVRAIEGLNEVNNWTPTYKGVTSIASGAEIQKQIFAAVNADPLLKDIAVYNVSIGSTDTNQFNQLGNLSNYTDYANEHAYVMSTTNISSGLDYLLSFAQISAPGKPTVITEAGYTTLSSSWYDGVDEAVQAKYTLNTLMDAYRKGVSKTYLYELLDESNLGASNRQSHFGLFRANGTPKPVATGIHNLTQILQDTGRSASAASNSLTYALAGAPTTSHDIVLAKTNGSVDLVLWAEPVLWNQNTHSEVRATISPVTVTFDKAEAFVKVYDPMLGTGPIATYANVSNIHVGISDHPLVIEVTPALKAVSAPPSPLLSRTTSSYVGGVLSTETTTYAAGQSDASAAQSTNGSGTMTPSTPSATKPILTIADSSLAVAGRGGKVDLGTKVTTTDSNDHVTVNISGLPRYASITDRLDGQAFRGNNITLTAAQVDSGLELTSYYRGGGHPVGTLTLTASAKDPSTGAVSTASPQIITMTDPRPAALATTTSYHNHHHNHHSHSHHSHDSHSHHSHSHHSHSHHNTVADHQPAASTAVVTPTSPQTIDLAHHPETTAANTGSLASRGFALLQQHFDPAASLETTAPQSITAANHPVAAGTAMAALASQSFALLNQYLAGNTERADAGHIVTAVSQAIGFDHEPLLAQPHH